MVHGGPSESRPCAAAAAGGGGGGGASAAVMLTDDWQYEKHLHCQHKEAEEREASSRVNQRVGTRCMETPEDVSTRQVNVMGRYARTHTTTTTLHKVETT